MERRSAVRTPLRASVSAERRAQDAAAATGDAVHEGAFIRLAEENQCTYVLPLPAFVNKELPEVPTVLKSRSVGLPPPTLHVSTYDHLPARNEAHYSPRPQSGIGM
jgi:hypothetical protein